MGGGGGVPKSPKDILQAAVQSVTNPLQNVANATGSKAMNTLAKEQRTLQDQLWKPAANFASGLNNGRTFGQSLGMAVRPTQEQVGAWKEGVSPSPEAPAPVYTDATAQNEADKKNKARTKRQAEIDILTDKPGRGGTVLTDQYQYKV